MEYAEGFCYPALAAILERGRQITSRVLFISRPNQPSQSSHPLVLLGYDTLEGTSNGTSQQCIDYINALTASASGPATMVFFTGNSGWLKDREFRKCLSGLVAKQCQTELVVWGNDTRESSAVSDSFRWIQSDTPVARLETYHEFLFPSGL